jgi:hypothetical protein
MELSVEMTIRITSKDRVGLINEITEKLKDESVNIIHIQRVDPQLDNREVVNDFKVEMFYHTHLVNLIHRLSLVPSVENVICVEPQNESVLKWCIKGLTTPIDSRLQELGRAPANSRTTESTSVASVVETQKRNYYNKQELREIIIKGFDSRELKILCGDLEEHMRDRGIDVFVNLDMFGNQPYENIASELINYLDRRGYLHFLVDMVKKRRPNLFGNMEP